MAENPFGEQPRADDAPAPKVKEAVERVESEAKAEDEQKVEEHPLFSDQTDDGDDDDGDSLFDEPAEDGKGVKLETFRKRVGTLTRKRREAETQASEAREALARVEAERDTYKDAMARFSERYAENPALALEDSRMMDVAEALSKTNPEVAAMLRQIQKQAQEGKPVTENTTNQKQSENTPSETDRLMSSIIERDARRTAVETLAVKGVNPEFQQVLADVVVQRVSDAGKLAALTGPEVMRVAKEYIDEKGLTPASVLVQKENASPKEKPPTEGKAKGSVDSPKAKSNDNADNDGRPSAPKDLDEWESRREARLRAFAEDN